VALLRPGIVHFGCGAFHRAHQAVYTQRAIEAQGGAVPAPWGIIGANLIRPRARDVLEPQDGLFTVLERGPGGARAEIVGSLRRVVFAKYNSAPLVSWLADPQISIVSVTVTPGGYQVDPAIESSGANRAELPNDQLPGHARQSSPPSFLGILVEGLRRVRLAGRRPPVLMSCDNMPGNGRLLRDAVVQQAALSDEKLASWIARSVQFPSCMVDRIVPEPLDSDLREAATLLGVHDAAPISAEPFRQWVIEDFEGPRPVWDAAGAAFVADVTPWEASKLRLLNGTHLAIACLGALAGLQTVSQFVQDPVLASYASRFMLKEQMPTLPPSSHDIPAYAAQLLQRWRNPGIAHRLSRVGRNGSEKLKTRLLASIADNLAAGRPAPCTMLAVAAWVCCTAGRAEGTQISDPAATRMRRLAAQAGGDVARLSELVLQMEDILGTELPRVEAFRTGLRKALADLLTQGPRAAVTALMAEG
jgi:fructuronate reductase